MNSLHNAQEENVYTFVRIVGLSYHPRARIK
jgi:hypothetical protein